jgi:hypothetical protein
MTPASDQGPLVVFESTGTPSPLFIELAPIFVRLELELTKRAGEGSWRQRNNAQHLGKTLRKPRAQQSENKP